MENILFLRKFLCTILTMLQIVDLRCLLIPTFDFFDRKTFLLFFLCFQVQPPKTVKLGTDICQLLLEIRINSLQRVYNLTNTFYIFNQPPDPLQIQRATQERWLLITCIAVEAHVRVCLFIVLPWFNVDQKIGFGMLMKIYNTQNESSLFNTLFKTEP